MQDRTTLREAVKGLFRVELDKLGYDIQLVYVKKKGVAEK